MLACGFDQHHWFHVQSVTQPVLRWSNNNMRRRPNRSPSLSCRAQELAQLIMQCWDRDQHKRPGFAEILERLHQMTRIIREAQCHLKVARAIARSEKLRGQLPAVGAISASFFTALPSVQENSGIPVLDSEGQSQLVAQLNSQSPNCESEAGRSRGGSGYF